MSDAGEAVTKDNVEQVREALVGRGGVMGLIAEMNQGIMEQSGLDTRTFFLVRSAALAATGAPLSSWAANLEFAEGVGIEAEELIGMLVAIAPIIGAPRLLQAAEHILED